MIDNALKINQWLELSKDNYYQCIELEHYSMSQRWLVVWSQAANDRSENTINNLQKKEFEEVFSFTSRTF